MSAPANATTDRVPELARGDPITAAGWNVLARLGNEWARGRHKADQGKGLVGPLTPGNDVLICNDTDGDLPAFVPVRLGGTITGLAATPDPLPYESRDRPLFEGLECDGEGVHVVTQEAIPEHAIGRAVVMGVTVARVASGVTAGSFCQPPASGNVELVAGGTFARVLTAPTGSGDRMALVLIGAASGGGGETVRTAVANDGTQWTAGFVQVYDASGNPGDGAAVEVKPVNGAAFGATSQRWLARDTGRVVAGKRRLLVERADPATPATRDVTVVTGITGIEAVCNGDGTITVTLDYTTDTVTVFDA